MIELSYSAVTQTLELTLARFRAPQIPASCGNSWKKLLNLNHKQRCVLGMRGDKIAVSDA